MRCLALETSSHWMGVAALDGEELRAEFHEYRPMEQSSSLLPAMRSTLAEAGWALEDLEAIAVDEGPGSFTGLRVGAAAARTLADALKLPVFPVPAALVLAFEAGRAVTVALAATRDAVHLQPVRWDLDRPELGGGRSRVSFAGTGKPEWTCDPAVALACERAGLDVSGLTLVQPRAGAVGRLALTRGGGIPARSFLPCYGSTPVYRKPVRAS